MKINGRRIDNAYESMSGIFAVDSAGEEAIKKCGEDVIIDIIKCRNPKFHGKAFSLFGLVLRNQDIYDNVDDLLVEIKLKCGHYREHITTKGKIIYLPKSISFENMEELDFQEFMDKAINVILEHFCIGMDRNVLEQIVRF